jgi:TfoX/Sxy family transcriptional regulator of competence genes
MAYDHALADRIGRHIGDRPDLVEKEMFGGLAFLIGGNMAVGVSGDALMVRVGKDAHDAAMARHGARPFDMTGRPMRGWIVVDPIGFSEPAELDRWVDEGVAHALTLPSKGG